MHQFTTGGSFVSSSCSSKCSGYPIFGTSDTSIAYFAIRFQSIPTPSYSVTYLMQKIVAIPSNGYPSFLHLTKLSRLLLLMCSNSLKRVFFISTEEQRYFYVGKLV